MTPGNPLRDIAGLASDAVAQATNLVQLEFRLARTEIAERAKTWSGGAALCLAGAVFGAVALFMALQAAVIALVAEGLTLLEATLLMTAACLIIAAILFAAGRKRLSFEELTPDRTINQLTRDKNMVKEKMS
jgi:membrane protein implicated in regulation of membrane protease activity